MSYYSHVVIVATLEAFDKIEDIVTTDILDYASIYTHEDTKTIMLYWDEIKWYSNHQVGMKENIIDQRNIEDILLNECDEDDYVFYRGGESIDDGVEYGNFYENPFDAYLTRSITFNFSSIPPEETRLKHTWAYPDMYLEIKKNDRISTINEIP